ncbi:hypothetical protein L3X38_036604 [Prunus dulcis]|uniref:Uncharacterized protein n=1 Tax=Prunus dulcis TaxID=3755 RepID=A0AAD4YNR2_PRUDU|nr:hypothetical protein L3X38_036604 [Prunus dulcis]
MAPKKSNASKLVRAPFPYSLEDIDWGSWETNLERLNLKPEVPLYEDYLPWNSWVDELMPRYQGKWMQNRIFYAIMLSKHQIELNPPL